MRPTRLTRIAVVPVLLLGALSAWWLVSVAASGLANDGQKHGPDPRIVLPAEAHDFGAVRQGAVLRTTFSVENSGARRLILVERTQGCCDGPEDPRTVVVAPGQRKRLDFEVDTGLWCGKMEEVFEYTTNDPTRPHFALTLTASVSGP